ncbi:hypothetical protein BYT27DRAFT_7098630 [Phlegmacium glaucopus]|nr:hypothetical protein BYT27DRAFT_7098630 [Phlegmacium glaucopus]
MGFCRRCGEIVVGVRCKCGGTAVPPVIAWKHSDAQSGNQDKWSKTYVSSTKSKPIVKTTSQDLDPTTNPTTPIDVPPSVTTRRFPRPNSTSSMFSPALKNGVSSHITLATTQSPRPPSPLKFSTTISDPESDILPSLLPHEPTLSKVYGSVLQPTETLILHSCAVCSAVFPPDATIYPNPGASDSNSFLCRPCFTTNGGSKGTCPSCSRPVLTLKSEGGFVHSTGKYWHKQCFNCTGCFKNIGESPLVDLLGRPSCADCFENCLNRDPATPKKARNSSNNNSPIANNPGGLNTSYSRKTRENSPALEELEQRLGIVKSREGSPAVGDASLKSLKGGLADSPQIYPSSSIRDSSQPRSPSPDRKSGPVGEVSPLALRTAAAQAVDQTTRDKRRISRLSNIPRLVTPPRTGTQSAGDLDLKVSSHTKGNSESLSKVFVEAKSIPSQGQARGGETKASPNVRPSIVSSSMISQLAKSNNTQGDFTSKRASLSKLKLSTSTSCAKCKLTILNPREGGQFIGIPGMDENATPQAYHPECFKCAICDKPLNEPKKGQVTFVKCDAGPCHAQCAPAKSVVVYKMSPKPVVNVADVPQPIPPAITPVKPSSSMLPPSSRLERPFVKSPESPSKPRFGGQAICPGCHKSVSLMEWGVIPGPQGTRWHASCLVCGGKKEITAGRQLGRRRETKGKGEPGCGKKLDSAARSDSSGGVWCRECLLLLGVGGSPQSSPTRSPLVPSFTGTSKVVPQYTGTTTIARQFTGMGGGDPILRQLTGGGLSPTRSISPTKQLGTGGRPRPKSVIGMRSIDEGRGMYLVKQLTGST